MGEISDKTEDASYRERVRSGDPLDLLEDIYYGVHAFAIGIYYAISDELIPFLKKNKYFWAPLDE